MRAHRNASFSATTLALLAATVGCSLTHDFDGFAGTGGGQAGAGGDGLGAGPSSAAGAGGLPCVPASCSDGPPLCGDVPDGCGETLLCACAGGSQCVDGACTCPGVLQTTALRSPTNVKVDATLGEPWTNAQAVRVKDADAAESVLAPVSGKMKTATLQAQGFGFEIPLDAQIVLVRLAVRGRRAETGVTHGVKDFSVRLMLDGIEHSFNNALDTVWADTYPATDYAHDWDPTRAQVTPSQINGPLSGASLRVELASTEGATVKVDSMKMQVSYYEACTPASVAE